MRQYVGARYMPKFMGLYDATQSYEALSVVDNGLGTSYICNQPTPAGTPLTDTTHWKVYGSTNGAIIDLQDRMTAAESDIDVLETFTHKHGDIAMVSGSYGNAPTISNNYNTILEPWLLKLYNNVYWETIGGCSFSDGRLKQQMETIAATCQNPNEIRTILVGSLANDSENDFNSVVLPAMVDFSTYCNTTFPNAEIIILPFSWRRGAAAKKLLYALYQNILKTTEIHGMACMNSLYNILYRNYGYYVTDGLHPNAEGALLIARAIYNSLLTGDYKFSTSGTEYISSDSHEISSDITLGGIAYMKWFKDGTESRVNIIIEFTANNNVNITQYTNLTNAWKIVEIKNLQSFNQTDLYDMYYGYLGDVLGDKVRLVRMVPYYDINDEKWYLALMAVQNDVYVESGKTYKLTIQGSVPYNLQ